MKQIRYVIGILVILFIAGCTAGNNNLLTGKTTSIPDDPAGSNNAIEVGSPSVFTVTKDGKVGVGTNDPEVKLEVSGASEGALMLRVPTEAVNNVDTIYFSTGTGTNAHTNQIASIRAVIAQANPSALQGQLRFLTNRGDSVTEAMRIDQNGNIGIGMLTDPQNKLHLHENSGNYANIQFTNDDTGSGTAYEGFRVGLGSTEEAFIVQGEDNDLSLWTNSLRRMTIKNSGNVGIGTDDPLTKLDVAGNIKSSGTICDGSNKCLDTVSGGGGSYWIKEGTDLKYEEGMVRILRSSNAYNALRVTGKTSLQGDLQIFDGNKIQFFMPTVGWRDVLFMHNTDKDRTQLVGYTSNSYESGLELGVRNGPTQFYRQALIINGDGDIVSPFTLTIGGGVITSKKSSTSYPLWVYGGAMIEASFKPTLTFKDFGGTNAWSIGERPSASGGSEFKIAVGTNIDSNPKLVIKSTGEVTIDNLKGTGNAYVCADSNGQLYRSTTACA